MSIFESLKEEKKLSLNHWRYRLLHWCFNVTVTPKTPTSGDLPRCLYTHYCPLFHLTNLIAIFSPFILLVKVIVAVVCAIGQAIGEGWDKLRMMKPAPKELTSEELREKWRQEDLTKLFNILSVNKHYRESFETFWDVYSTSFQILTREELEPRFLELCYKLNKAEEQAELRKKKLKERLIFWTNFSQVFLKWFMNIAYFLLLGVMIWGVCMLVGPFLSLLKWFGTFDPVPFLLFTGKVVAVFLLVGGVVYMVMRLQVFQKMAHASGHAALAVSPPFLLVWAVLCAPVLWVGKGWYKLKEFVGVFYEENCPPISIVSEQEEKLEEVANA